MNVEIAYSGESMLRPKVRYPLHRIKPGPSLQFVGVNDLPVVVVYHWHKQAPVIHTTPVCLCSELLLPSRERAYVGGLVASRDDKGGWVWNEGVVEVTERALEQVRTILQDHNSLRGAKLGFKRRDARKASALEITDFGYQSEDKLPPALDLVGFIHTLWDRFLPPIAKAKPVAADARVSWEDPSAEIPY